MAQDFVSARVATAFAVPDDVSAVVAGERAIGEPGRCDSIDQQHVIALVRKTAEEEGFDGDLAEAVAWAESDLGRRQGPSKAGALGIMQLMAGTASDLGVADRCDATANVRAGIRYLKSLYEEFKDPLLMLAAYNAGAGNVYKSNGIPVNEETAKYVVKILNRWKLGNAVHASSSGKIKPESDNAPDAAEDTVAWQDGHVMDFGN